MHTPVVTGGYRLQVVIKILYDEASRVFKLGDTNCQLDMSNHQQI